MNDTAYAHLIDYGSVSNRNEKDDSLLSSSQKMEVFQLIGHLTLILYIKGPFLAKEHSDKRRQCLQNRPCYFQSKHPKFSS